MAAFPGTPAESSPAGPYRPNRLYHCRSCEYDLRGLTTFTCPECGRPFDPHDDQTFLAEPRNWIRRHEFSLMIVVAGGFAAFGILALLKGDYLWGVLTLLIIPAMMRAARVRSVRERQM